MVARSKLGGMIALGALLGGCAVEPVEASSEAALEGRDLQSVDDAVGTPDVAWRPEGHKYERFEPSQDARPTRPFARRVIVAFGAEEEGLARDVTRVCITCDAADESTPGAGDDRWVTGPVTIGPASK